MHKTKLVAGLVLALSAWTQGADTSNSAQTWSFAVSGDSRNCGDVIMPAIAADAIKHNAAFYWHLGDLRKISGPDQDFIEERTSRAKPPILQITKSMRGTTSSQTRSNPGEILRFSWESETTRLQPRRRGPSLSNNFENTLIGLN